MTASPSIAELLGRALVAYEALGELAEDVDDEWSYIQDLTAAWRERLDGVVGARGSEPAPPGVADAIDRITDEVGRITDPHRAIDWLSTFPQVVLVALGEAL